MSKEWSASSADEFNVAWSAVNSSESSHLCDVILDLLRSVNGLSARCLDLEAESRRLRAVIAEVDCRVIVLEGPNLVERSQDDLSLMASGDWIV